MPKHMRRLTAWQVFVKERGDFQPNLGSNCQPLPLNLDISPPSPSTLGSSRTIMTWDLGLETLTFQQSPNLVYVEAPTTVKRRSHWQKNEEWPPLIWCLKYNKDAVSQINYIFKWILIIHFTCDASDMGDNAPNAIIIKMTCGPAKGKWGK